MFTSKIKRVLVRAAKPFGILAVASALAAPSLADVIGPGMVVMASDGQGNSAMYAYDVTQNTDGTWGFADNAVWEMYDSTSGALVATINPVALTSQGFNCSALYVDDPIVTLNFAVAAGPGSATTTFMIASALLDHPDIASGAQGRASAGFSVTDGNASGSAQLIGIGDPNGAQGGYLAQYNGFAGTVSGTTFAEMHHQIDVTTFAGTTTANQNVPPVGFNAIAGAVVDMSSLISFTLTRSDLASGTTNFEIIPEPASLGLLLLGAALIRRRS